MKRAAGARARADLCRSAVPRKLLQKTSLLLKSGSDDVTINHGDHRDQKNPVAPARSGEKPAGEKLRRQREKPVFRKVLALPSFRKCDVES